MAKKYYSATEESILLSLYSSYSEKMQRHFLATEHMRLGSRSIAYLTRIFSCSPKRIRAGRKELAAIQESKEKIDYSRQRRAGGGAKKKK